MADEPLIIIDLCKGFKIAKRFEPSDDVDPDVATPLGISPMGCQPAYGHFRNSDDVILSLINQKNGNWLREELSSLGNQSDLNPFASGMIAGLRGINPISGSTTVPDNVPLPQYEIHYTVDDIIIAQELNSSGVSLPAGAGYWRLRQGGLGTIVFGMGTGVTKDLIFAGQRWEGFLGGVHKALHTYDLQIQFPYSPIKEPMTMMYSQGSSVYYITKGSLGGAAGSTPSSPFYDARVYSWDCHPCLIDTNGTITNPSSSEPNGPSLSRKYSQYRTGNFTMPDFEQTLSLEVRDVAWNHFRNRFCIYATPRVTDVTVNGLSGAQSSVTLPRLPNDGLITEYPDHTFTQLFEFAVDGDETLYTFQVSGYGQTVSMSANLSNLNGLGAGVRAFEGWADIYPSGNPVPDYY